MLYSDIGEDSMKNKIKRIKLFPNHNDKSRKQAEELKKKLEKHGYIIDEKDFSLGIAVGGDGSFIRMVKETNFSDQIYYLGVNTGTLGFAQEIYPEEIDDFIEKLKKEDYKIEEIGVEETKVETKEGVLIFNSLNEILVRDKDLNATHLNIYINENLLEKFVGDGILVSTSFGSTAYNLNFGGSIVYNDLHTMQITPVAPLNSKSYQVLRNSVIIPEKRVVSITPTKSSKNLLITVDGENRFYNDVSKIEVSVNKKIKFLRMNEYDYTKKINEKFL